LKSWRAYFHQLPLPQSLEKLVSELQYFEWVEQQYPDGKVAVRKRNEVLQFIAAAERYIKYRPHGTLKDYLERVLLQDNQDSPEEEGPGNEVTLMTLHSSKGLEF